MLSSPYIYKQIYKDGESETKLRECKALRTGVESCPPTWNGDEGAETVRHNILLQHFFVVTR